MGNKRELLKRVREMEARYDELARILDELDEAVAAFERFGAVWGQGVGLQGRSYGIPTMQGGVETIRPYVDEFVAFARSRPDLFFLVTRIGCGIAGFRDEEIAPLFAEALPMANVALPESFVRLLSL